MSPSDGGWADEVGKPFGLLSGKAAEGPVSMEVGGVAVKVGCARHRAEGAHGFVPGVDDGLELASVVVEPSLPTWREGHGGCVWIDDADLFPVHGVDGFPSVS